jgi:hypothetical protein
MKPPGLVVLVRLTLTRHCLHYFVKKERVRLENTTPHTQRECQNEMVAEESRNLAIISPLTIDTTIGAETNGVDATHNEAPTALNPDNNTYTEIIPRSTTTKRRKSRLSSRQVNKAKREAKGEADEFNARFKEAFKEATRMVAKREHESNKGETVNDIIARLNETYGFTDKSKRKLSRTTVDRAVAKGNAGKSPEKRGPVPLIPPLLLEVTAAHVLAKQVGEGELRGRDIKRTIGAAIKGSELEKKIRVESVWRKLRNKYPEELRPAPTVSVDDARAQWTIVLYMIMIIV